MKNRKRSKGPADSLLGLLFPAVLLLVMVINLIVPDREMSEAENRKLAEKPQLSMNMQPAEILWSSMKIMRLTSSRPVIYGAASGYP